MSEQWALLWSKTQNCMNIELLEHSLSSNRQAYTEDNAGDYRVIAIGGKEEMHAAAEACRSTMAKREMS